MDRISYACDELQKCCKWLKRVVSPSIIELYIMTVKKPITPNNIIGVGIEK